MQELVLYLLFVKISNSKSEKDSYIKINSKNGKFNGHYMTVYTEDYKNLLVQSGICSSDKISVIGMPRADFYFRKDNEAKNHILFLIPTLRQPYG